ncbi:MAG: glycosyltransferase [Candidatus Bathyarchaeia archaeon]
MEFDVTIGICVRNCQNMVIDTLKSVVSQDFPKDRMEVIIVDDGSTDGTLKNIKDFISDKEVKIRLFSQRWGGIASARNVVVKEAKGKYIIWVDGDMRIPRNFVSQLVNFMNNHQDIGAAKGNYGWLATKKIVALLENVRAFDLQQNSPKLWGTGGSIYRTCLLREVGGFDEKNKGAGEDIDLLIRIQKKGWRVGRASVEFYEIFKETWKDLWRQYYWWGRGARFVYRKYGQGVSILPHLPPLAFLISVVKLLLLLKRHARLAFLLLPIHYVFKEAAWCCGFFAE